jgi:hypothetical protein
MIISRHRALASVLLLAGSLAGCGIYVPDIVPSSDPDAHAIKVNKVINHVKCELREAVLSVLHYEYENMRQFPERKRRIPWLDNWGAWLAIKFAAVEKGALNAGVTLTDPLPNSQSFTLGFGGTLSSEATRTDKVEYLFVFSDFIPPGGRVTRPPEPCKGYDGILIDSDLKIKDWLWSKVFPYFIAANIRELPPASKTMSYEVSFAVVTNGNITPTWKLVRVGATGNPLASIGRTQTDNLTITMGEVDKKLRVPSPELLSANLATQIGSAVATAIQATR